MCLKSLLPLAAAAFFIFDGNAANPENLRVNALRNPVTVDTPAPRFSWNLSADERRGTSQSSYRILVTDPVGKTVWDSGAISSADCSDIDYAGEPLQPFTRYAWSVTTTDSNGKEAKSSEKAWFETGFLSSDWDGARWITPLSAEAAKNAAIRNYKIEADIEIANVAAGIIFAAPDHSNYYMWQFNLEDGYPRFRPHRWVNNAATCLEEIDLRNIKGFELNKPFHVSIVVNDDTVDTYIDGVLINSRKIGANDSFRYGEVAIRQDFALRNYSNPEKAYFDNLTATDITGGRNETLLSYDFNSGSNPFDNGSIVDGRLFVSGSYAWQKKTEEATATAYDLDLDFRVVNDAAGVLFSADSANDTFMWSVIIKGGQPILRRHIRTGGNWTTSDVNLSKYTSVSALKSGLHHMKIAVRPGTVTTYLDDNMVDTFIDTSGRLHYGKTGFRTFHDGSNNEIALYDNIVLRKYATSDASDAGAVVFSEDFEGAGHCYSDGTITVEGGNKLLRLTSSSDESCVFADLNSSGMPVMRRSFATKGKVKSARISAAALGVFDLRVNGARVGLTNEDGSVTYDELKPGWTDYRHTVNYYSYDITPLLREGENVVGAELSNGWWAGGIAHGVYGSNTPLSLIAKIDLEYADGSTESIITDESWKSAYCGPLVYGDIYNGEIYDARRDYSWSTPAYNAADWVNVEINPAVNIDIVSPAAPPVRIREWLTRKPQTVTLYNSIAEGNTTYGAIDVTKTLTNTGSFNLPAGETAILDFGQNLVGNVKINVKAPEGTKIRIRFGEMLNDSGRADRANQGPEGSLYTYNLRNAVATIFYTASGAPEGETYSPTTSFFGFRYCEITASSDIDITDIRAQVLGSDIEEYGELTTSHKDVNQLISNIRWGQRGNFLSIPTDCPQRDERLGWTGDTQIFSRAASYASDTRAFYRKWMDQMRQGQRADGAYPDIAPFCNFWGYGTAAWGDAGVIVPWTVYTMTGDKLILEENYEANRKYMQFLANQGDANYKYNGSGTATGDWLAYENLDARYVAVAYYAYAADLMAMTAEALDKPEDAAEYHKLRDDIAAEFRKRYVKDDNIIYNAQTAYLLALTFDLLENDRQRKNALTALKSKFEANGYLLQTGFVGTGILNTTLSENGLDDFAYNLLLQRNNPSWLYSVDQGATTIWERWDSYTLDGGFNKHPWNMNSFNHYAYGVIYEWMMRYMAGIEYDPANPGFKHIILQPRPDTRESLPNNQQRITNVAASTRTPMGTVASKWENHGNGLITYDFTVPTGATATLYLPAVVEECTVLESGVPVEEAEGVTVKGYSNGCFILELKSGSYNFNVTAPAKVPVISKGALTVSPIPFHDRLLISGDPEPDSTLSIVSDNGMTYYLGAPVAEVSTATWPEGIYIITLTDAHTRSQTKAIKR